MTDPEEPLEARYQSGVDQTSTAEKRFQAAKYNEIIEILLSAGYFRARISGLSEFDKVVGGLCWCITSSGAEIDVDILFQENSTIGQRIKLSETIVLVLRKMRAHQIQGSDFPALHPVIVWLVKKFFENREATAAQLRKYAQLCFDKDYSAIDWAEAAPPSPLASGGGVASVAAHFRPQRKYRRQLLQQGGGGSLSLSLEEDVRVHSCLLEYGESVATAQQPGGAADPGDGSVSDDMGELSAFERKLRQATKEAEREEEEIRKRQEHMMKELMKQMSASGGGGRSGVSGSEVGRIVGLQAGQISQAAAGYEEARRRMEEEGAGRGGVFAQIASFNRQKDSLQQQLQQQQAQVDQARSGLESLRAKVAVLGQAVTKSRAYNARIMEETAKLTELEEKSGQKSELSKLRNLVVLNESLKAQESQFKAGCKRQLAVLQEELRVAKKEQGGAQDDDDEAARLSEVEALHAKTMARYDKMRQLLSERSLSIASTTRLMDDVPSRAELIQYERRFTELYDQVSCKLEETRKWYDYYNTLDTTRDILRRQVKLLSSISESFETAVRDRSSRGEFLRQFQAINKGVEDLCSSKVKALETKTSKLEEQQAHYQSLLEEQRRYFKAVKDFQDECNKNDILTAKLAQMMGEEGELQGAADGDGGGDGEVNGNGREEAGEEEEVEGDRQ